MDLDPREKEKNCTFSSQVERCAYSSAHPSSIRRNGGCHICQTSCLRCDVTSLPLWDQHSIPLGAEPEVVWGRNLPTAPLGFPELQRPKWTAGQLGLGTGARPDMQSARRATDKTYDHHTRTQTWTDKHIGLPWPSGSKDTQSVDLVCVGASVCVDSAVCDAQCDVGVMCWCYGSRRSGWIYHVHTHTAGLAISPTEPDDSQDHNVCTVSGLWISRSVISSADYKRMNCRLLTFDLCLRYNFVQKDPPHKVHTWFTSSRLFTQVDCLSTCEGTFTVEQCCPFSYWAYFPPMSLTMHSTGDGISSLPSIVPRRGREAAAATVHHFIHSYEIFILIFVLTISVFSSVFCF